MPGAFSLRGENFARASSKWRANCFAEGMATRLVEIDRDTAFLLPPNLRDWPANHLVHFVIDAAETLDLRKFKVNTRGTGDVQYPPAMLLGLLVYSYATGVFGSRRIEQSTYDTWRCGYSRPTLIPVTTPFVRSGVRIRRYSAPALS